MTHARARQLLRATLQLLKAAGLENRYTLIGGAAINAYNSSRSINDIDILLGNERDVARLRPHLEEAGFHTERFSRSAPTLLHRTGKVDVLDASLDPVWERAWRERVPGIVLGIAAVVPTMEALVALKQLASADPEQAGKAERDLLLLAAVRRGKGRRTP